MTTPWKTAWLIMFLLGLSVHSFCLYKMGQSAAQAEATFLLYSYRMQVTDTNLPGLLQTQSYFIADSALRYYLNNKKK